MVDPEIAVEVLAYSVFSLNIAILGGGLLYLIDRFLGYEIGFYEKAKVRLKQHSLKLSLLLASVATAGSLYMSNILEWTPCKLCWFQRIFMYPLVVLLATGIYLDKDDIADYVLPMAMIGLPIALFHSLEQRYEQYLSAGCSMLEVSCATKYTFYFGYITIPVMAFTAFLGIIILLWRFRD